MKQGFFTVHPAAALFYFVMAVFFCIVFFHPVILGLAFIGSFLSLTTACGIKSTLQSLCWALPVTLFAALLNPLFNHRGSTVLVFINDSPITLEATVYGILTGIMIVSVIFWMRAFSAAVTSHQLLSLCGRAAPTAVLIVVMSLRFIPYFRRMLDELSAAQSCLGISLKHGNFRQRLQAGGMLFTALTAASLESTIGTADSMKARGYGLRGRSHYSDSHLFLRDWCLIAVLAVCLAVSLFLFIVGILSYSCFPTLPPLSFQGIFPFLYIAFAVFFLIPILFTGGDWLLWLLSKRNISRSLTRKAPKMY